MIETYGKINGYEVIYDDRSEHFISIIDGTEVCGTFEHMVYTINEYVKWKKLVGKTVIEIVQSELTECYKIKILNINIDNYVRPPMCPIFLDIEGHDGHKYNVQLSAVMECIHPNLKDYGKIKEIVKRINEINSKGWVKKELLLKSGFDTRINFL